MLRLIAFDADDTLWHTEDMFQDTQKRLGDILEQYAPREKVDAALGKTEKQNIKLFGYGIKGFTLSMVETAIDLSDGRIEAQQIHEIVMMGKKMLDAPMRLFIGVEDVLRTLKQRYLLAIITKGDLLDQTNKVYKSGLADLFDYVEVVSEKDVATYSALFQEWSIDPASVMMIGNSVPSDIVPVLELGGHAVHIPYEMTAVHEIHHKDPTHQNFTRLTDICEIPDLIDQMELRELI
ncbi:HAD family hydrolase [Aestuariispira insulae]|uniref:Putative hydrolase of the HAD superfamily n=1 Tax=Aestuariispira insulae TaxID=1461337 RepID=A0A3D9HN15_9PROT|nr:HAD family hydrolase [Aestuariispira insulae]RED50859.1 putative hydrolase of the HAD superfamily [Aestuariispira insulae]